MTPIIIASHGEVALALLKQAERMLGPQELCVAVELQEAQGREDLCATLQGQAERFGGKPLFVIVDMLGGTPWNAACAAGLPEGSEVFAGASLPLILEALMLRGDLNPAELGEALEKKAGQSVARFSTLRMGKGR